MIYTAPISFHKDIKADLALIRSDCPAAHAKLLALLQQLKADPKLAEKLLDHGFGKHHTADISVSKWMDEWKSGNNLWRLKSWEIEDAGFKYRLIYLYLPKETRFVVMAVVERGKFDYDDKHHPIRIRITQSLQRSYGIG